MQITDSSLREQISEQSKTLEWDHEVSWTAILRTAVDRLQEKADLWMQGLDTTLIFVMFAASSLKLVN